MQLIAFDTDVVPRDRRLATFRAGASDFAVDALGDAGAFSIRWRMLALGDVNVIHTHTSPVRYRRTTAMIAADGNDRITIHHYLVGGEVGTIDGRAVEVRAGGAMVWDLARPLDLASAGASEAIIFTLPRYMIDAVLPAPSLAGPIAPSRELDLAIAQARHLVDHADALPDASAALYGRALRDMLAVAMIPAYRAAWPEDAAGAPLLQRIVDAIDDAVAAEHDAASLAARLGTTPEAVLRTVGDATGPATLVERRRLLCAYRMLGDPAEVETVRAIAARCGFRSLSRFSQRFQAIFHASASDVRRTGTGDLPDWAGAYPVDRKYGALMTGSSA